MLYNILKLLEQNDFVGFVINKAYDIAMQIHGVCGDTQQNRFCYNVGGSGGKGI